MLIDSFAGTSPPTRPLGDVADALRDLTTAG